ncbi:acyl-CoA thioesterase [Novosphingobium panipatense]|jgi:acyl-CoA thioester hydrolase|uniref:Acyl-CoA thioester hydrolase n=1 Tax=Novosphingobium panipatense TaxID=428991 RepID=A0ABY1QEZ2_9SPHN|nr:MULTISPECIES: acyl-CoA thioesterase [Novosphingobium]SMP67682.1 acyl-CoA thioester hydrolase [Novosphingobium panipatense]
MPKPDPALLDPARYPFFSEIEPRFADLDLNMHINNVAMAAYLEDGRVRFHRACGYRDILSGFSSMIVSLGIEYLGEGHYPDTLQVHSAVERVGRSSHGLVQLLRQNGRLVAFARSTMVAVGEDGPEALPPDFLAGVEEWKLRS